MPRTITGKVWLITVKVPKNPDHNPRDKKTGECPVNGTRCTDVTGEHHTFAMELPRYVDEAGVHEWAISEFGMPVTRVEETEL